MIENIVITNVGDTDAPYWHATTHCNLHLAQGNDKLAVIREANKKYAELQAKGIKPTTPNFENSDVAFLCRIGLGEVNFC